MRLISQNGEYDIPYEKVVLQRHETGIYFLNACLTGVEVDTEDIQIAEYSTEEKAVKTMEMLRNTFADYNGIFQFPQDNEI